MKKIGTATTIRLVTGLLWLIANDYCFFSATTYSTSELLVDLGENPGGYSRLQAPGRSCAAPGATLYSRAGNLLRMGSCVHMRRVEAKIVDSRKEDPA